MKCEYNIFERRYEIEIAGNTIIVFLDEESWQSHAMLNGFEIASAWKCGFDLNIWFGIPMPKAIEKEVEDALFNSFPSWNGKKFRRVNKKEGSYRHFLWYMKLLSGKKAFEEVAEEA